jgi:hypothetical protein
MLELGCSAVGRMMGGQTRWSQDPPLSWDHKSFVPVRFAALKMRR